MLPEFDIGFHDDFRTRRGMIGTDSSGRNIKDWIKDGLGARK